MQEEFEISTIYQKLTMRKWFCLQTLAMSLNYIASSDYED